MMRSPDFRGVRCTTFAPFRMVPFLLPRSCRAQASLALAFKSQVLAGEAVVIGKAKFGGAGTAQGDSFAAQFEDAGSCRPGIKSVVLSSVRFVLCYPKAVGREAFRF